MVVSTLRNAVSGVAATMRSYHRPSPFYVEGLGFGRSSLERWAHGLFRALEKKDPPPRKEKAIVPDLLRDIVAITQNAGDALAHTRDLIVGAYFFAMRACEFVRTKVRGQTKRISLENLTFRDRRRVELDQRDPDLRGKAAFVTVCFVNQKNGDRMDRRSQRRTSSEILCPVRAWCDVVQRIRRLDPRARPETPVCQIKSGTLNFGISITDNQVIRLLRTTCRRFDGERRYGIKPQDLGSRSIRLGAAMALFLQHQDVKRIKILGRWKSNSFEAYIRPQVLEWTDNLAEDMAMLGRFTDLAESRSESQDTVVDQPDNTA